MHSEGKAETATSRTAERIREEREEQDVDRKLIGAVRRPNGYHV